MKTKTTKTKTTRPFDQDEFALRGALDSLTDDLGGTVTVGPFLINRATRQLAIGLKVGGFLVVTVPTYEGDDEQIAQARKVKQVAGFVRLPGVSVPDNRPLRIEVTETKTYTIPATFRAKVRRDLATLSTRRFISEHDELLGDIEEQFGDVEQKTIAVRKVGR